MHNKRGISQTNPKDPSPIRASFPARFRSSDNPPDAAKADEPKTSEYAFFKKLKIDAGHTNKFNCRPLNEVEIQPNKLRSSDFLRERTRSPTKSWLTEFRLPIEDVTGDNHSSLLVPVGVDMKKASTPFQDIWSTRNNMEESRTLRPAETQNKHEDLFTAKRKKLCQWVADVSFPEIEELYAKGYVLVSVLLSRLFPESKEENNLEIPISKQVENVGKSNLLASPRSNIHLKNLHDMSTRNFMEVKYGSYSENGLSSCWLDSLRERTLSNSNSPTCHFHNNLLDYDLREPCIDLGVRSKISRIKNDYNFSFRFKNYGCLPSSRFRESDDFHDPDDSLLIRGQKPVPLGWDSENERSQTICLSSLNTGLIPYPMPLTSWVGDHEQNLDEFGPLGVSKLCTSSVVYKYAPNVCSLPPSHATSYCEDEYGRHFLEDMDDMTTDLNHFPLSLSTLSHIPSCPSLTEDRNYDFTFKGRKSLPSPGNNHWFISEVCSELHYDPGPEVLSSKLDFDLGGQCSSISNPSNKHYSFIPPALQSVPEEGIFTHFLARDECDSNLDGLSSGGILTRYRREMANIHDWSSFYFHVSLNKEKAWPVLLDKSSWDESKEEI